MRQLLQEFRVSHTHRVEFRLQQNYRTRQSQRKRIRDVTYEPTSTARVRSDIDLSQNSCNLTSPHTCLDYYFTHPNGSTTAATILD